MHSSRMRTSRLLTVSPSMHSSGGCTWSPGVYLVWGSVPGPGMYLVWGYLIPGVYLVWGMYLVWGVYLVPGGVPSLGGTWSWGVYLVWGYLVLGGVLGPGVPGLGGGTCPDTPPCEQNDRQTGVKILPCPKLRLRAVKTNFSLTLKLICINCYI